MAALLYLLCTAGIALIGAMAAILWNDRVSCFSATSAPLDPNTGLPLSISVDQLGYIEGQVAGLQQVIAVADMVEDPEGELRRAVKKNLERGIRYTFIISKKSYRDEHTGYFKIFKDLAEINNPDTPADHLVHIRSLNHEWLEYPYVFYRCVREGEGGVYQTFGYRGTETREGIADRYELLTPPEVAHTVARLAFGAVEENTISPAIGFEEFVGDPTSKPSYLSRRHFNSKKESYEPKLDALSKN